MLGGPRRERSDPLQHLKQVRSFERRNRFVAEIGNHPLMDLLAIPLPGGVGERCLLCQQPFVGDGCESVGYGIAFSATLCTGVNTVRYRPPSFIAFLARSFSMRRRGMRPGSAAFLPLRCDIESARNVRRSA